MHSRILHIINQILENNNILLKDIEIVTPDEKDEILYKFNDTKMDYPKDKTIVELFEEQVEKKPDNIAVVFEDQKLTYKELNEKSNQLANYLLSIGINQNSIITVCMSKNIWFIISILAVQKIGCAYLPVNPTYPLERLKYIFTDSHSSLLLSDNDLPLKSLNIKFLSLNIFSKENLDINISSNDLAYVIYTSGSTGNPKGVMITHDNLINFLYSFNNSFDNNFSSKDICLSLTNISFDVSVAEIFTPFIKNKITFLYIPPTILSEVFSLLKKKETTITKLLVGVSSIKNKLLNNFLLLNPKMEIINGYGPTEATICSTFYKYVKSDYENDIVPIGSALYNNKIFIVHKSGNLQPNGIMGELCVSGCNVGKGYLGNQNLTSKCFTNGFKFFQSSTYHTGDIAYYSTKGILSFVGRNDSQVKFRGYRIELEEITNRLKAVLGVENAVTLIKKVNGIDSICSYVTGNNTLNIKDIKDILKNTMPLYMVPSHIILIDKMPLNANGKIDTKNLPEPEVNGINKEIILPRNEVDSKLIDLLKKLLNINSISIDDSFFELGADSLSAINLCAQIQTEFNVQIHVKDILENPVVRTLSDIIAKNINTSGDIVIKSVPNTECYTVSSAQKRMYFASTMAGNDNILYNIPGGVILNEKIDAKKIEKCLNTLVNRHESLRTYFELNKDTVVQRILDNIDFKLDIANNVNFEELNTIFQDFVKPFDLSKAPLFRASLVNFTNGKCALLVDMHHIISDGTSLSIIIDELCKLYNDEKLPELKITYKDFAAFENKKLISGELKEAEDYWVHQFEGEVPVLNLPTKNQRPAIQSFEGKKVYSSINLKTLNKINKLAKELEVTPYMILLATYYILLYKYTSQDDIVVGSPVVGRDIAQTYNLVGMFVNSLPLREKIDSSNTFKNFLLGLKENLLNSYKYQTYPFDELVNKLQIKRDPSRNPLFDTMFTYQNNGYETLHFNNISSEIYNPDVGIAKFDLSVEIIPNENGMEISFEYSTKLFEDDFIQKMLQHYINILNILLNDVTVPIFSINMLTESESNNILNIFNNNILDYPKNNTIVDIFEEQVKKSPDNIAIIFEDKKLTYRELNENANSLAHYLHTLGIGKNDIVPVILPRSAELIISLLAIIKCGAIYLPISTDTPFERMEYILQNSEAKIVITKPIQTVVFDEKIHVLNIDEFDYLKYDNNNLNLDIKPSDLLYIIYTSGSTGNPKGVKITHNNLANFVFSFNNLFEDITSKDKLLASTNISFDVSIFEIFMPLLNGASLYLYDEPTINDIFKYCKSLTKHKITFAYIPPNILEEVYNILSSYSNIPLNKLLLGVEPIKSSVIKKYYNLNPSLRIVNAYGPTETTICSTAIVINKNILNNYKTLPIGKPLSNLKIFILDRNMQPVPIGVPGEIYISGDNVSKGYLNNKDLTNKVFISIPHLNCKLAYKTGDLAKWDENGIINFIGRNDSQIKLNGHRIELGEIESCVYSYPNIDKVVVLLDKNNKINCYFTSSKQINTNDLKAFMQRKYNTEQS